MQAHEESITYILESTALYYVKPRHINQHCTAIIAIKGKESLIGLPYPILWVQHPAHFLKTLYEDTGITAKYYKTDTAPLASSRRIYANNGINV